MHDTAPLEAQSHVALGEEEDVGPVVQHFRQIVLWPLQIVTPEGQAATRGYHTILEEAGPAGAWTQVTDEFGSEFHERHYREFVSFLPHVQRFLYGDASDFKGERPGAAPVRVYRRHDIKQVRITLNAGAKPIICDMAHADLYFFHDVDAVILAFEISADNLPFDAARGLMHRFGRAYPSGWSSDGAPVHCPALVEWLDDDGAVIESSDYEDKSRYLGFVGDKRAARISRHWTFLLKPLVSDAGDETGPLRYREIEYSRMPVMAYLAFESSIESHSRENYMHLALATAETPGSAPFSARFLKEFDARHAYDRFYADGLDTQQGDVRFLTSGEAFSIISGNASAATNCNERGLLGQFRHQYFLLFLIAHFHKAALLMLSDRMVAAIKNFDPSDAVSVRRFRNETFGLQESFLRFSQRYLFTEISGDAHMRDIFHMIRGHLAVDKLHHEVRGEIMDMVQYLDSNALRRQSGAMHRLTVVTIVGLVGTIATGFLGMNLLDEANNPLPVKATYFGLVIGVTLILTSLTIVFSRSLASLLEKIAGDDRRD